MEGGMHSVILSIICTEMVKDKSFYGIAPGNGYHYLIL